MTNEGDAPETGTAAAFAPFKGHLQLSRFKLQGDTLKLDTEEKILEVPVDRGICCHVGGNIDFDGVGNLFLSTGDDTNPFASDGYSPIDDSPNRNPAFDARRSAGNTNDLRGKILRIRPKDGGGYTIPQGNLFKQGTASTKPEIFAMGLRNPFRFAVNRKNGDVYVGDYSPDAGAANALRGPAGHGRWMLVNKPANFGWPYCVTPTIPYIDYDFATKTSGEAFNCNAPTNDSPYNTGLKRLPSVTQPDVWYSYDKSSLFPELGPEGTPGGIAPMGGPAYDPQPGNSSPFRFPNYFKGVPLFYEWSRDYIKEFRLNGRQLGEIRPFSVPVDNPMDIEYGPDGALYVLEYGDGYFAENEDAQLAQINFVRGNHTPIAKIAADVKAGRAPLTVKFSQRGDGRPRRRPDRLRVGLRVRRQGRLDRGEPDVHVRQERHLPREPARHRPHRAQRVRRGPGAGRQRRAGGRADHDAPRGGPVRSSATPSTTTSRSPTTRRSTARRSASRSCSATRRTGTRSPRARAAPARSRRSWTAGTPAQRTSAPCSSPPTPTPVRAARPA